MLPGLLSLVVGDLRMSHPTSLYAVLILPALHKSFFVGLTVFGGYLIIELGSINCFYELVCFIIRIVDFQFGILN